MVFNDSFRRANPVAQGLYLTLHDAGVCESHQFDGAGIFNEYKVPPADLYRSSGSGAHDAWPACSLSARVWEGR